MTKDGQQLPEMSPLEARILKYRAVHQRRPKLPRETAQQPAPP